MTQSHDRGGTTEQVSETPMDDMRCSGCGEPWEQPRGTILMDASEFRRDHDELRAARATIAQQADTIAAYDEQLTFAQTQLRSSDENWMAANAENEALRAQLSERDSKLSAIAEASTYRDATPDQLTGIVGRITAEHSDLTDALEERDQQLAEMRATCCADDGNISTDAHSVQCAKHAKRWDDPDAEDLCDEQIAAFEDQLSASRAREEKLRRNFVEFAEDVEVSTERFLRWDHLTAAGDGTVHETICCVFYDIPPADKPVTTERCTEPVGTRIFGGRPFLCGNPLPCKDHPPKVTDIDEQVASELRRAVAKFPTWPTDPLHAIAVLGEEFGELTKAVLQLTYEPHKTSAEDVRGEAIQTAAMALRFARSLERYQYVRGEQHEQ